MQAIRHQGPLAEAAPAVITLDPARLLGGLPAQDGATASRVMVGDKQGPFEPEQPPQDRQFPT